MLKIGTLKLDSNILLAPLAGISDSSFRLLCRKFGARFTFVEMINARAISAKNKKTKKMLLTDPKDKPIGIQLLGAETDYLLKAMEIIKDYDFDILDFNAACPVRKVCRRLEGAALMKEPKRLKKILSALSREWKKPFTIKIRSGWDETSRNAVQIAKIAEDSGTNAIFIHGRHRQQFYKGNVDYSIISEVKKNVSIPVIASGDVWDAKFAKRMLDQTGCDGLLVARGSLGNPWIFREIDEYLKNGVIVPRPDINEIIKTMRLHLEMIISEHGEKNAIPIMRKFIGWYLKGKPFVRAVRQKVNILKTKKEFEDLLEFAKSRA